jgi:hypothetical protein
MRFTPLLLKRIAPSGALQLAFKRMHHSVPPAQQFCALSGDMLPKERPDHA